MADAPDAPQERPKDAPCFACGRTDIDFIFLELSSVMRATCNYCGTAWHHFAPDKREGRTLLNRRSPVPSGDTSDDTRRLDWLEAAGFGLCEPSLVDEEEDRNEWRVHCASGGPVAYGFTIRAAIDAAFCPKATP